MQQEREAGIEKGRRIGLAEGEEQLLRRQVQKNLSRGMSISEIAEVLDETDVYCIIKFPKVAEAIPQSCRGNFPNNAAVFGASLSLLGW